MVVQRNVLTWKPVDGAKCFLEKKKSLHWESLCLSPSVLYVWQQQQQKTSTWHLFPTRVTNESSWLSDKCSGRISIYGLPPLRRVDCQPDPLSLHFTCRDGTKSFIVTTRSRQRSSWHEPSPMRLHFGPAWLAHVTGSEYVLGHCCTSAPPAVFLLMSWWRQKMSDSCGHA